MPDVPLYTAVISGCAAVVGAAIPTIANTVQNVLAARRDRWDRYQADKRQACVELVQAAENLRTQVANNHDYHGDEMGDRLAQVRAFAAQARIQAVRISLAAPPELAQVTQELAAAASRLAEAAEARTDLRQGASIELPPLSDLDTRMAVFRAAAARNASERRKRLLIDAIRLAADEVAFGLREAARLIAPQLAVGKRTAWPPCADAVRVRDRRHR
jgi:hypothetical protein